MKRSKLCSLLAATASIFALGCAGHQGMLPETGVMPEVLYISPGVSEAGRGRIVIPIVIPENAAAVAGYRFIVFDDSEKVIFVIEDEAPARKNLFGRKTTGVALPSELVWDGRDQFGAIVADGIYRYRFETWEANGLLKLSSPGKVYVDATAPVVEVSSPYTVFSPNGDGIQDSFLIHQWRSSLEPLWVGRITDAAGRQVWSWEWEGYAENFYWTGLDDAGNPLPEGDYFYTVSATDRAGNKAEFTLGPITIDVTPPIVNVTISPQPFSPDGDGVDDTLSIRISTGGKAGIQEWKAEILDPGETPFISYSGEGAPLEPILWDGRSSSGELVQSAHDYPLIVTVTNTQGIVGVVNMKIPVDVLVQREGDKLVIVISSIYFKPYTADFEDVGPELAQKNLATLDRLAQILKKFSAYRIGLEGHAVRINWDDEQKGKGEEAVVLLPLSTKRAEAIKQALIERGIEGSRMAAIGFGGLHPVVPHSDLQNRWKNRRVEFVLVKN